MCKKNIKNTVAVDIARERVEYIEAGRSINDNWLFWYSALCQKKDDNDDNSVTTVTTHKTIHDMNGFVCVSICMWIRDE